MQTSEMDNVFLGRYEKGVRLLNVEPGPVTHEAAEGFIELIQRQRQQGYGFVPFVGAGFSAPSGVPLVRELRTYLGRCICMALGAEEPQMRPWNPREDQWPPFIDRGRTDPPEIWREKVSTALDHRKAAEPFDPQIPVFEQALGAMAEWRAALAFLSRLVRESRGTGDFVSLDAPRQEIIDACLREILKGRYPTLGHRMLAGLAGALRLDLILTTNFDDLLESAFVSARNPLEVLDVTLGSNLPHWSAVTNVRSLIKLHGNRYSLRADYSLDAVPSETDKQRFVEYLISGKDRARFADNPESRDLEFQNHLLVMGFSANDRRIRSLLEHAWTHLNEKFRVFWMCYTETDVTDFRQFVADYLIKKDREDPAHKPGGKPTTDREVACILRHPDHGLLLLQIYQQIRRNLPPLGSPFPSVSRLTLPPQPYTNTAKASGAQHETKQDAAGKSPSSTSSAHTPDTHQPGAIETKKSFVSELRERLKFYEGHDKELKLVIAMSEKGAGGVTTACAQVFDELQSGHACLWLDMNDISSTDNLFEVLLEAAYVRIGLEHWTPAHSSQHPGVWANEIKRLVNSVNSRWVVFLNARETPGANIEEEYNSDKYLNGWLDKVPAQIDNLDDEMATAQKFVDLLVKLCDPISPRLTVVLLCRNSGSPELLVQTLKDNHLQGHFLELNTAFAEYLPFSEDDVVRRAIDWANKDAEKQRFLHAIVLTQRPRLLAAIWSRAFSRERYETKRRERSGWITDLQETGLIRRKPGGFIWVHSRCRQALRNALSGQDPDLKPLLDQNGWHANAREFDVHTDLADWYSRVLDASESPAAVFEIVYHQCRAARVHLDQVGAKGTSWACARLDAASALLKSQSYLIQTRGYSRGSCRRLDHISESLCTSIGKGAKPGVAPNPALSNSLTRLRVVCAEIKRAIAREVGEDGKAYQRHKQLSLLLLSDSDPKRLDDYKGGGKKVYPRMLLRLRPRKPLPGDWVGSPHAEWVRWLRWNGMLGIASRSFAKAKSAIQKAVSYAVKDNGGMAVRNWHNIPGLMTAAALGSEAQQLRAEALRSIELYVSVRLLEISVKGRVDGLLGKVTSRDTIQKELPEIEECIDSGQRLARLICESDHSFDSHNAARAVRYQGRLLMHSSTCAARRIRLGVKEKEEMMQPPMALLGDAEACISITALPQDRSELALIELHRAEARMSEAETIKVSALKFVDLCRQLENEEVDATRWLLEGKHLKKSKYADIDESLLRRAGSLVNDSIRFLNRAEPVLRERRRNVWWTTWFFERRLRAIAYSVWTSILETETPIPFLGLEASMRKTPTLADTVLEDAVRMIRTDPYRLATIIDAYFSCAKALQIRLMFDPTAYRIHERQASMYVNLKKAIEDLDRVSDARTNSYEGEYSRIDADVQSYITEVRKRCVTKMPSLKEPFY